MKKAIIPMGALALLLASCDPSSKDSYQTIVYPEYNLIVDNSDMSQPAQVSGCKYEVKFNISKGCIDIKTSDLIINNNQVSFETDTIIPRQTTFIATINGQSQQVPSMTFFKNGQAGVGSSVADLSGKVVFSYVPNASNLLNYNYTLAVAERLDMKYTYSDRYSIQTLSRYALYLGETRASEGGMTYSTKGSDYLTDIDFQKKTASVYVYNAEFSSDKEEELPKVICFEEVPVVFTHEGFSLEAVAPKTKVLGTKDNKVQLIDSVGFEAKDFSLFLTSQDLTETVISYKLAGKDVNFRGCSVVKQGW